MLDRFGGLDTVQVAAVGGRAMASPLASPPPAHVLIEQVERRIATVHNRDTLMHALWEVLRDAIDFGPRELPTADEREWLRGAVALPIHEASEVAMRALVWHMAEVIDRAPSGVRGTFDRSHVGQELGRE
jgi:hypothetical protein